MSDYGQQGYWQQGKSLRRGEYRVKKILGMGGFGTTYLAIKISDGNQVAIKSLNPQLKQQAEFGKYRDDFIREAMRLAHLNHSHIVKIKPDFFTEDDLPCFIMEFIPGKSLGELVSTQGKMSVSQALKYIQKVGEAVKYLHQNNPPIFPILHRDIKPHNIIIREDSQEPILIDFGISRQLQPDRSLTKHHSEGFSPIEQSQYNQQWEESRYTDVYSLAATLYYLLTAEVPPPSKDRKLAINDRNNDPLNNSLGLNNLSSDELKSAILKGMAIEPQNRYQTVRDFLTILSAIAIDKGFNISPRNIQPENERIINDSSNSPKVSSDTKIQETIKIGGINTLKNSTSETGSTSTNRITKITKKSLFWVFLLIGFIVIPLLIAFLAVNVLKKPVETIPIYGKAILKDNPNIWEIRKKDPPDTEGIVAELLPKDNHQFRSNKITITINDLPPNKILNDLYDEEVKKISDSKNYQIMEQNPDFTFAEKQGYKLVYQGVDEMNGGETMKRISVATVKNNKIYAIIYEANSEDYQKLESEALEVIENFEISQF